ncbi:MAG: methyltransferase domain-containing protein [candidate division NC10 bacterium]|nr:methyltransferase domain-containing protein [candidate division NC10 bacterium]
MDTVQQGQPEFGERYGEAVGSAYDRMAEEYDVFDAETPFLINDSRVTRATLEALRPRWEGKVVLDVGAGTGLQTAQFAPRARRVLALDLAADLLRKAREKVTGLGCRNVTFLHGDATFLPLPDGSVDFVCCYGDVIGLIPDYATAIAEMARVCRPGGTVTIEYDNKWHVGLLWRPDELARALRARGMGDKRIWTYTYLTRAERVDFIYKTYTGREMTRLLTGAGLRVVRRLGLHMASSIVPEPYQTVYKDGQPLYDTFKRIILALGRLDALLQASPGMSRVGYAAILVAEKPDSR